MLETKHSNDWGREGMEGVQRGQTNLILKQKTGRRLNLPWGRRKGRRQSYSWGGESPGRPRSAPSICQLCPHVCSGEQWHCGSQRNYRPPPFPASAGPFPQQMSRAILTGQVPRTTALRPSDMDDKASGTLCSSRKMRLRTFVEDFSLKSHEIMSICFHEASVRYLTLS